MATTANIPPSFDLEELCEHLESGEPVPEGLAKSSTEMIRAALADGGKLDLGKKAGRPSHWGKKVLRSDQVAFLMVQGLSRDAAIISVAQNHKLKPGTIEKDYKKFGKYSRKYAKAFDAVPLIKRLMAELQNLLTTFKNQDGSQLVSRDIAFQIAGSLNPRDLQPCISEIESALRRDVSLLRIILSPAYDDVLLRFELVGTESRPI